MKPPRTSLFNFLLIFLSILFSTRNVSATHAAGGNITYQHISGNCYSIRLTFYRDCLGIPVTLPIIVSISSAACSQNTTLALDPIAGTGQEITVPCPGHSTTCTGGNEPGIQKWEFESQYCFPAQCADWLISIAVSARNSAITTLQNPGSNDIYIEARLNNLNGDNNSPQFSIDPSVFMCLGQDLIFNNGMVDPDGDSLAYSLIPARTDANTNVTYIAPYNGSQPLTSVPLMTFDTQTGDLFVHPVTPEVGVIAYQIMDFRNGVLMGSVMRDMIVYTIPCSNLPPFLTGVNGTSLSTFYVLPGSAFCFNVFSYDPDITDTLTMSWNNGIPPASFTIAGQPHPTGVFCWAPDSADVRAQPYSFTVNLTDNKCPSEGIAAYTYSIIVTLDSSLVGPLETHGYFSGNVYYDINGNGIKDSIEVNLPYQGIQVLPDGITVFTNSQGDYLFYTMTNGSHLIHLNLPPGFVITSDSASYTLTDDSLDQAGFDFGINASSVYNKLDVAIAAVSPRCNSTVNYYLSYQNTGTTLASGRVAFVIDDSTVFLNSTPAPDLVSGDTLFYNFSNLWPFSIGQVLVLLNLPGAGTPIHFTAFVQFDSLGTLYSSGVESLQQVVTCSLDPNDKTVLPEGLYAEHRTLYNDTLLYTIRFQNTGTDTAFTVIIHDVLDPALDLNTFHITGSSHPVSTTIYPGRMLEFRFDNIMLPDSGTNEQESHGFVQYKIIPRTNVSLPAVVVNSASIFFDSNLLVTTNTVTNTLVSDLYVSAPSAEPGLETAMVVPNPFTEEAAILLGPSFKDSESALRVMNIFGELVLTNYSSGNTIKISRGKLAHGIYFYEVKNKSGHRAVGKFVID
jgi:uncharacterized repeat protein (TIGR01451 family)